MQLFGNEKKYTFLCTLCKQAKGKKNPVEINTDVSFYSLYTQKLNLQAPQKYRK